MDSPRQARFSRPAAPKRAAAVPQERSTRRSNIKLQVTVIFTTIPGTAIALRAAAELATHLDATIRLIVLEVVPYPLRLDRPPVLLCFTAQRLRNLTVVAGLEAEARVILCRDSAQALLAILKPRSLIVLGARKCWWPTREKRLARLLGKQGHEVILADLSSGGA